MIDKEVHAYARFIRMAPRKVRLVIDVVRGLPVIQAQSRLQFLPRTASLPVQKLLESAMANAHHNFSMNPENLFVKRITADGGPTLHRWRARAMGRAAPIRKRTTHIHIVLAPMPEGGLSKTEGVSEAKKAKKKSTTIKKGARSASKKAA